MCIDQHKIVNSSGVNDVTKYKNYVSLNLINPPIFEAYKKNYSIASRLLQ